LGTGQRNLQVARRAGGRFVGIASAEEISRLIGTDQVKPG
jgi:hypothetical protein